MPSLRLSRRKTTNPTKAIHTKPATNMVHVSTWCRYHSRLERGRSDESSGKLGRATTGENVMAGLLTDEAIFERVFDHIDNKTTDVGDEVWREPVENYRSTERHSSA